jgi:hypothetical protein
MLLGEGLNARQADEWHCHSPSYKEPRISISLELETRLKAEWLSRSLSDWESALKP